MKVLLFEVLAKLNKKCINKDLAGGMGTGTWVGDSLRARIFEKVKKSNVILPDITIAYLAAIFNASGWQAEYLENESDFSQLNADLALVPISIVDCQNELKLVKKLRQQKIKVGVYGTIVSARPDYFISYADLVIVGEAEAGALKIISEKELPSGILKVEHLENINILPFPDWSGFPIKKYSYSPALNKKPILTMLTSRGCPYSCSYYCAYPARAGKKWRTRSVENVVSEIEYLIKTYKVKAIDFRDAIFTLDKSRTYELAQEIIKRNLKIIWSCETRLDCLDKKLIKVMYQAGFRHLNVGIESVDPEVLKSSNRLAINQKQQEEIISACHKLGISVAAFYILGLEADNKENILSTIDYAKKLNTLVAQFAIATPYPGTLYFDDLQKSDRLTSTNWEDYDSYTPIFKHKFLSPDELLALKEKAFISYYFRFSYLFRHMPKYIFEKFLWPF